VGAAGVGARGWTMSDWIPMLLILVAWFVLQRLVLPRLGVPT
jgi:p-aminobenzoyl-glutamate transporter AbgT